MKANRIVVACVAVGIAITPFCANRFRPHSLFFDSSLEQWFVSALKGGDAVQVVALAVLLCAVIGLVVGLLMRKVVQPADTGSTSEVSFLRTPGAAAILIPIGTAAILLVAYNHTPQALDEIVWPDFISLAMYCIPVAVVGAISAGLLNVCERAFERASLLVKAAIICCLPLAMCVGVGSVAGIIGSGLLGGLAVGQCFECPVTGAWTGVCIAVAFLAVQSGIFWPAYFPLTNQGGKQPS
jgi:hypothetical protein